mmetsp:Transcript_24951/g.58895  ORF Transcript_24951/g.58895 Transcript_24951/m.58895 type:complete len:88 (+) Transcript_24951:3288-3551(+)
MRVPKFFDVSSITSRFIACVSGLAAGIAASAAKTTSFDTIEIQQKAVTNAKRRHRLVFRNEKIERFVVAIIFSPDSIDQLSDSRRQS